MNITLAEVQLAIFKALLITALLSYIIVLLSPAEANTDVPGQPGDLASFVLAKAEDSNKRCRNPENTGSSPAGSIRCIYGEPQQCDGSTGEWVDVYYGGKATCRDR